MFRRAPYIGWLLSAVLLWCLAGFRHYLRDRENSPKAFAAVVSKDLQKREDVFDKLAADTSVFRKMFDGTLSPAETKELAAAPYYIYAWEEDILIFWNSNIVLSACQMDTSSQEDYSLFRNNGVYVKRCLHPDYLGENKTIVILFPVAINYPFENEYLKSHFAAGESIPPATRILDTKETNSIAISKKNGDPLFYLQFNSTDIPKWVPDFWLLGLIVLGLLFSFIFIHLTAIVLSRRRNYFGLLVILIPIVILRIALYFFGLPFHLGELNLFNPQLYAANSFLPSLGDLLLNVFFVFWIALSWPLCFPFFRVEKQASPKRNPRWLIAPFIGLLMYAVASVAIQLMRSLVMDSNISFEVTDFYSINANTIIGLCSLALIACTACYIIFLLSNAFIKTASALWIRVAIILGWGIIFWIVFQKGENLFPVSLGLWLLVLLLLLEIPALKKPSGSFSSNMIFWAAFVSFFSTAILLYFNNHKEQERRKLFAETVVKQKDEMLEYLFDDFSEAILKDRELKFFFDSSSAESRTGINEHLATMYFKGQLNRYKTAIYLFDPNGQPLLNEDTTGYENFADRIENAEPTVSRYLYHRPNAKDAHYYIAYIPVYNNDSSVSGYVILDMNLKKAANESVYPELLQPEKIKGSKGAAKYSYGIYLKRQLITQTNDYPFPVFLRGNLDKNEYITDKGDNYEEHWYRIHEEQSVLIIQYRNLVMDVVTMFSYLLGVLMIFTLTSFLFRFFLRYLFHRSKSEKLIHLTLRKRIHFAMTGLVLLSFFIIGTVTIVFFTGRYNNSNRNKLQAAMQVIERSVQQYIKDKKVAPDDVSFDVEISTQEFKYFINNLSNSQSIDVNVYNSPGSLRATSQDDIYDKSLLARIMRPDAYYLLSEKEKTLLIQKENIGQLDYLSCYVPLRNDAGEALGYIHVPFFSSQKELNFQISNILVALINLYAVIFLLSSLFAVFISNWLTKTLQIVISKFERLDLHKNELLEWPYDDEIGILIREYNKMVKKVEENAAMLAQSERETAWREMARQVAHEIKNPLTPMKLNIQYLQQAVRSGHPNVQELTMSVADSLVEQIDNLSHIASAFSNFATMPEAQPEHILLNELLANAVEIYQNNETAEVHLQEEVTDVFVYADKSQLLRVFTNLLQNAVEAIPGNRKGKVNVYLQKEAEHLLIRFTDNGDGIPADVRDKIFSPYFTTKGSGTGLGLAMTKKIVEFWKGKIWFETEAGNGTTFFVQIPFE